jgi:hypothetical protein
VHKKLTETQLLLFFTNNKIFMTSILSLILAGLLKKNIENLKLFSFSMIWNGIVQTNKEVPNNNFTFYSSYLTYLA